MAATKLFTRFRPVIDNEEELRYHLLWFLFIRVILYTLLLGITFFLHTSEHHLILPPPSLIVLYIVFLYLYSIASAFLLKRVTHLPRFGLAQLLSDTFFIALLVYATGCSQSIFPSVFILPIIAGGLILYRIGGLIPAAGATILYGAVLTSEYLGLLPDYYRDTRYIPVDNFLVGMNIFAVYGLTFFLIALLSGMIAGRLRTAEDALSRTELKFDRLLLLYKQIFDDIQTGIITVDSGDRITSFNPAATTITGFDSKEVNGRRLSDLFPQISVQTRERQVCDLRRRDGSLTRVGYSSADLHLPAGPDPGEAECSSCRVITLQDISRIEAMERQMRQAEKMAAIGEMSASIAHDFRNPLAAISGSAQLLSLEMAESGTDGPKAANSLAGIIVRESERMAKTITDFLQYARPATPEPQWCNLERLVAETVRQLGEEENLPCPVRLEIPANLDIAADRQLLQIGLLHLLRNGCYAARDTGKPVVVRAEEIPGAGEERAQVVITVIDQGPGLTPEAAERLFEPFYSTRQDSSGLGLPIVQQIAAVHGGTIELVPGPEKGCVARLTLPLPQPPSTP